MFGKLFDGGILYMYNDIKLEKGLYNLSGKSFTAALEELDPSGDYCGTPLEKLDAYERQLKRFNIRVSGQDCERVEKFFSSTESAVLFPEFVTRCIRKGFNKTVLFSICAAKTVCRYDQYLGCILYDSAEYATAEVATLPIATVHESSSMTVLAKYGRHISTPYEMLRQQRLDVFGVMLRSLGVKLATQVTKKAIEVLAENITPVTTMSLTYADLARLYGEFDCFNLNALIVSPVTAATIIAMDEISGTTTNNGGIILPFGAELIKTGAASDNFIIGIDRDFALEFITSSDLVMETDKLIDRQLDQISVSITCGFRKITPDAVKVLSITT